MIIASGGPAAAVGLLGSDPGWGDLGAPVTAACLDLGLTRPPERPVLFGFAEPLYLSTHCPPADLAPEGGAVVQLMRYGARDAATDRATLTELATGAGIAPDTIVEQRFLAHMHVAWTCRPPIAAGCADDPTRGCPGTTACSSRETGSDPKVCSPTRRSRAARPRQPPLGRA